MTQITDWLIPWLDHSSLLCLLIQECLKPKFIGFLLYQRGLLKHAPSVFHTNKKSHPHLFFFLLSYLKLVSYNDATEMLDLSSSHRLCMTHIEVECIIFQHWAWNDVWNGLEIWFVELVINLSPPHQLWGIVHNCFLCKQTDRYTSFYTSSHKHIQWWLWWNLSTESDWIIHWVTH